MSRALRISLLAAPGLLGLALAIRPIDNFDTGFILRIGERVATTGIPVTDPFSFPGIGKPWVQEQWLGAWLYWRAFVAFGIPGAIVLKALACCVAVALSTWAALRASGSVLLASLAGLLGAVAGTQRFNVQPNVFTTLFVAITLALLYTRRGPWLLPLLFAIWAHVHPGYLSGLIAIGCFAFPALLRRSFFLALVWLACAAAVALSLLAFHPFHLAPLFRALAIFHSLSSSAFIQEYAPMGRGYRFTPAILALLIVPVACWLCAPKQTPLALALLWLAFGIGEIRIGRLLAEASIVLAPAFAQSISQAAARFRLQAPRPALLGLLTLLAAFTAAASHLAIPEERALTWPSFYYPVACYEWLDAHAPARGFNDLWFGGSFIFHFDGRRLDFIDGRSFYSDDFFEHDYLPIRDARPGWEQIVSKWDIQYFLLKPGRFLPIHRAIEKAGWRAGFRDPDCEVYLRD
jgi:hypothetical protein